VIVALSNPDRERLAKLLGLLGSDHQGERDAAGLAAHRLVVERGLVWADVVCLPQTYNAKPRSVIILLILWRVVTGAKYALIVGSIPSTLTAGRMLF
jgi:hypothetical protein